MIKAVKKLIIGAASVVLCLVAVLLFAKYSDRLFDPSVQTTSGYRANDYLTEMSMIYIDGQGYLKKDGITSYLIIGVDTFGEHEDKVTQADFLTLLVTDEKAGTVSLIPVNRDTVADIGILGIGGVKTGTKREQLALAYTYGDGMKISCRNTVDAVSNLMFGMKIDQYICLTMDCVREINDFIGGVSVTFDKDYRDIDRSFRKGRTVLLDGEQALSFVRSRKNTEDETNISRMSRQSLYMEAFIKTVTEKEYSYSSFRELYNEISDYIVTDCDISALQEVYERAVEFAYSGITDIPGEAKKGDKYMEFYADDKELKRIVTDMFYTRAEHD